MTIEQLLAENNTLKIDEYQFCCMLILLAVFVLNNRRQVLHFDFLFLLHSVNEIKYPEYVLRYFLNQALLKYHLALQQLVQKVYFFV